jgi:hypothetical protein
MYYISILKCEDRRSGKDRRESAKPRPSHSEMRTGKDRRIDDDRRGDIGRRKGMYYRISDNQKEKIDKIIHVRDIEDQDLLVS